MNGSPVDMTMNIDETGKVFYTRAREVCIYQPCDVVWKHLSVLSGKLQ